MTDKELQELLDAPETPEEKTALDALASDPEVVLAAVQRRNPATSTVRPHCEVTANR